VRPSRVPRIAAEGQSRWSPARPYRGGVPSSPDRPLEIAGCRALCSWHARDEVLGGEPLFGCDGCGSEWVASEGWTPVDHTGQVPAAVLAVVAGRRARGRG